MSALETCVMDILNHNPSPEANLSTRQAPQDQVFFVQPPPVFMSSETPVELYQADKQFTTEEINRLLVQRDNAREQRRKACKEETNETWQELLGKLDYSDI